MKKFNWFALFPLILFMIAVGVEVLAQSASPTPGPSPVAPAASAPGLIDSLMAHKILLGNALYVVADLLVWLIPSFAGNGLLHQLQLWAGQITGNTWGQA